MSAAVVLLAATQLDAKRYLRSWPALRSPVLAVVTLHSLAATKGLHAGALFVTPEARKHPLFERGVRAVAPCFEPKVAALPPKSRPPRPAEYRRVGGGEAQRYRVPDHRGDGIRRAAELIRAGGPVGQIAAVIRDAAAAHIKPLFDVMQPASQVTVSRTLSMLPEAVELAGLVVELPPAAPRTVAEDFEDQVDRDAGLPASQRKHRGRPFFGGTYDPKCDVCGWDPQATAHAATTRDAAQAIRRAHNPNGVDD